MPPLHRRKRLFIRARRSQSSLAPKPATPMILYPRMLAEFMPKYIPGSPNIIMQNVPGAASMIAANQVYNVAKPDGLTLGAIYPALYFEQLTKKPEVKFDWTKFTWIGNPVTSNHLLYMRSDTAYKSMDDIRNAST